MNATEITDSDFQKFREFFYGKTGIHFEKSKRYFVDKRLVERIERTGSGDFRRYLMKLRVCTHQTVMAHSNRRSQRSV